MINLIPNEEKKRMTLDFNNRLWVLFLLVMNFSILVACISIVPAYIFSVDKNAAVKKNLDYQNAHPLDSGQQQSLDTVKALNNKLLLIKNAEESKILISQRVVNAILLNKDPKIKITQIDYTESDPVQGKKISISGTAPTREDLLAFRQTLEENTSAFKKVDLPISNFVKESDLQFSLSLSPS